MSRELYLLIHEHCIDSAMMTQSPALFRSAPAHREIARLRARGVEIVSHEGNQYFLPGGLPDPADDLVVKVIGAYLTECVAEQYRLLLEAGYNAEIHNAGCVP